MHDEEWPTPGWRTAPAEEQVLDLTVLTRIDLDLVHPWSELSSHLLALAPGDPPRLSEPAETSR
jgi:hypothetical protein